MGERVEPTSRWTCLDCGREEFDLDPSLVPDFTKTRCRTIGCPSRRKADRRATYQRDKAYKP